MSFVPNFFYASMPKLVQPQLCTPILDRPTQLSFCFLFSLLEKLQRKQPFLNKPVVMVEHECWWNVNGNGTQSQHCNGISYFSFD
jgi:hypothetical protein